MEQLDLFPKTTEEICQDLQKSIEEMKEDMRKTQRAVFAKCEEVRKDKQFLWDQVEDFFDRLGCHFPPDSQ